MLNQTVQRAQPPTRSSSLRNSTSLSVTSDSVTTQSRQQSTGGATNPRLAVELQRLHELKRQVAAQEQRLATLRGTAAAASTATGSTTTTTVSNSNGSVSHG